MAEACRVEDSGMHEHVIRDPLAVGGASGGSHNRVPICIMISSRGVAPPRKASIRIHVFIMCALLDC